MSHFVLLGGNIYRNENDQWTMWWIGKWIPFNGPVNCLNKAAVLPKAKMIAHMDRLRAKGLGEQSWLGRAKPL